ncbi:MAG: septal junction protein FraD [Cyanobacteria bacterium P01_A01_bin.84]
MNYLNAFLKPFEGIFEYLQKLLIPQKAYSWQILIYLSIFSLVMSFFATEGSFVESLIAYCGWFFLIAGTAWYTTDKPILIAGTNMPVGAVITAGLVSIFFFSPDDEQILRPISIVLWPTIAAIITAIPEFFEGSGTDVKRQIPKVDVRQELTVLIAVCMMLSCWINLYFLVDKWLQEYPSIRSDNFCNSILVARLNTECPESPQTSFRKSSEDYPENGKLLLERLTPKVELAISAQPWSQVEKWLLKADERVRNISQEVKGRNQEQLKEEKQLWNTEARVSNTKTGYRLDLLSIWKGPTSDPKGFYLKKSCKIEPVASSTDNQSRSSKTDIVAEIECQPRSMAIDGSPPERK